MVGKEEEEDKNFYLSKKTMQLHCNVQCNCIEMFNATALECSMQLHWSILCIRIGVHGGRQLCTCSAPMHCIGRFLVL